MTDIKPYIKQIIDSGARVNADSLKVKASELLGANKVEEATLILNLLSKDTFTKADKNSDGNLSADEIAKLTALDGDNNTLTETDLSKLKSEGTPGIDDLFSGRSNPTSSNRSPASSTPASSATSATYTTTPYTGPKISEIESYFKEVKENRKNRGISTLDHTNLPSTILNNPNMVARACVDCGGEKLRIIVHPKNYTTDSTVQEYEIDFKEIQRILKDKDINVIFGSDGRTVSGPDDVKLDPENEASVKKFTDLLFRTICQGNISNLSNLSHNIRFRQGIGLEGLKSASFGAIPEPQVPPNKMKYINADVENAAQAHITSQSPQAQSTSWCNMDAVDGQAFVKLYKTNNGYRLILQLDGKGDHEGKRKAVEYKIPEDEIKRLASSRLANIDFNDINNVRDWIVNNLRINDNPLTAFIEKEQGLSQLGEIKGLEVRRSGWEATTIDAFNSLKNTSWGTPSVRNGTLPNPAIVRTPIDFSFKTVFTKPANTLIEAFKYGDTNWNVRLVTQKDYSTIYMWDTTTGSYNEYVIETQRIIDYLKEKTNKDYSRVVSPDFRTDSKSDKALLDEFRSVFSQVFNAGWQDFVGSDYYFREDAKKSSALTNMEFGNPNSQDKLSFEQLKLR